MFLLLKLSYSDQRLPKLTSQMNGVYNHHNHGHTHGDLISSRFDRESSIGAPHPHHFPTEVIYIYVYIIYIILKTYEFILFTLL